MAESFEAFHVPQQSRRDKLRVPPLAQPHYLPLYDPSSFVLNFHGEMVSSSAAVDQPCNTNRHPTEKVFEAAGPNLMGSVHTPGSSSSSSSSSSAISISHHPYLDPNTSVPVNPAGLVQVFNSASPFLYNPQNLREFHEQSFNNSNYGGAGDGGGDDHHQVMLYNPEPLSLSLSSQNPHHHSYLPFGGFGISGGLFVGGNSFAASALNEVSRGSFPVGPFTGYASVMSQSRFLKLAQQLLDELCYNIAGNGGALTEKFTPDPSLMEPPPSLPDGFDSVGDGGRDGGEARRKKYRLLTMLDEIYRKYKQYYQQMQAVVSSFECVAGLGNAAPFANLALKAMTKHFRCLKNAISDQLQFANKSHLIVGHRKDASPRFTETNGDMFGHKSVHGAGFLDHQSVWRPHRGLPERAVTVLRAWLFEHFLHPYPTDTDKLMLAKQTGLSRNQVSNWFINARVRLWKPMVEEIHMLETKQAQKSSHKDDHNAKRSADHLVPNSSVFVSDNPSTSTDHRSVHDFPLKRNVSELMTSTREPIHMPCTQPVGINVGGIGSSGSSAAVSLTLGLHQNHHHHHHQIGLSEPFPVSAVQAERFGLNLETNDVIGGFDSQNRHFGRDVMGGQLLHDFVR